MAKPIETEWREFCKASFAEYLQWTHPQQYIDLRRTFYGGAKSMLTMLLTKLSSGNEVTEADMQVLRDANREFQEFAEAVKKGLA